MTNPEVWSTDRDELERRAAEAYQQAMTDPKVPHVWRHVLDAIGLTEETVWSDDGDQKVQDRVNRLARYGPDGLFIGVEPATDDELRALGLVKKRRWIGEWEVVDD